MKFQAGPLALLLLIAGPVLSQTSGTSGPDPAEIPLPARSRYAARAQRSAGRAGYE
jgi:hypothetical protein